MTSKPQVPFEIPGIQIVKMTPGDFDRFKGLLDGFQQNVPQSGRSQP